MRILNYAVLLALVLAGCGESSEVKAAKAKAAAEAERERLKRIVDDIRVSKTSVPDHTFVPKPEPGLNDFTKPKAKKPPSSEVIFLGVAVAVVLVGLFLVALHVKNTCPKCKRRGALKKTGKRRWHSSRDSTPMREKVFGIWVTYEDEEEVKCKYCGYRHWREMPKTP